MTFDEWRDQYDTLTFAQHQQANQEWAGLYPHQASFNLEAVERFLEEREHGSVVELGGWDGQLAARMLHMFPCIETWVNYDITNVPQVCHDPRYERIVLSDWPWLRDARGDALIASHVFEHMRAAQIGLLIERWDVAAVFVDAPVNGGVWDGYHGSHILEVDVPELISLVESAGFRCSHSEPGLIAYFDR